MKAITFRGTRSDLNPGLRNKARRLASRAARRAARQEIESQTSIATVVTNVSYVVASDCPLSAGTRLTGAGWRMPQDNEIEPPTIYNVRDAKTIGRAVVSVRFLTEWHDTTDAFAPYWYVAMKCVGGWVVR